MTPVIRPSDEEDFYISLAVCVQEVVGEELKVDRRTLSAAVGTWKDATGIVRREAIVWDPSTSGMLEHLLPRASDLVSQLVERLDHEPDLLSYVRFDNQFMVAQGRFRLDLLRSHFLDPVRRQHLPQGGKPAAFPAEVRPDPLRSRAIEAVDTATPPILLVAPCIAPDAFGPEGLLRLAHAAALRQPNAVRLLLRAIPRPDDAPSAVTAAKLREVIDAGVEVRHLNEHDVFTTFPRVLFTVRGARRALGAVRRDDASLKVTEECFGSDWGRGFVTLEAIGSKAEASFSAFETAWSAATVVEASSLAPKATAGVHYVAIREGMVTEDATSLTAILTQRLGPLEALGRVQKALYVDRYVAQSAIATWNMCRSLEGFAYKKRASVRVRCLMPRGVGDRDLAAIFADRPRDPLSPKELDRFCSAFSKTTGAAAQVALVADRQGGGEVMRHGRKLLMAFEDGAKLRTLKVELEAGMDWIFAASPRNWHRSSFRARETHFVIVENHDLEAEKSDRGVSEWDQVFGRTLP